MILTGYIVISLIVGGWMIFDGVYVLLKGKYFGPEQPGPWSRVVRVVGLNPFSLGIPFIVLGSTWWFAVLALLIGLPWAWALCVTVAVATLWYVPVGTSLSLAAIGLLILLKG